MDFAETQQSTDSKSYEFILPNEVTHLGKVTLSELEKEKFLTPYTWNKLVLGGNGEFVEDLVCDYLVDHLNVVNIIQTHRLELWDLEVKSLTNEYEDKRIEVRRFSTCKKTINLGHTSQKKSKDSWIKKAELLGDGGYFGINICMKHMDWYYFPAQSLIDIQENWSGNNPSMHVLNDNFNLNINLE